MPRVQKSVLVMHPAATMFQLVDAVEQYPQFLPWCAGGQVLLRDSAITRATIAIRYAGVAQSFTTENTKEGGEWMRLTLLNGPFQDFSGHWRFHALSEAGCKIEFALHYTFTNAILEKAIGPVFGMIVDTLVDRFVARADALAGAA